MFISAREGEPVDQWSSGVLSREPHQAPEAFQVHRDLRHHAGERQVMGQTAGD